TRRASASASPITDRTDGQNRASICPGAASALIGSVSDRTSAMPKTAQATSAAPASSGRDAVAPPPSRAASSSAGSTPGRASCGSDIVCTSFTCSAGTGSAEQRRELVVLLLHELGELLGVPVDD